MSLDLYSKCSISSNTEGDRFVGLSLEKGNVEVHFPLGYELSKDEKSLRHDIINLLSVLKKFSSKEKELNAKPKKKQTSLLDSPIASYLRVIANYLNNGYYYETEIYYKPSKKGKINWNKTIKEQQAYINNKSAVYLNFIVRDNNLKQNQLITLIHQYCVYISFKVIGWLYTNYIPQKPVLKFNKNLFISTLYSTLHRTFDDNKKQLLKDMIDIVLFNGNDLEQQTLKFGTDRFEYIWEKMIDYTFGEDNKQFYFPKTHWNLTNDTETSNAALEPDTIMIHNNNYFILDAKYYKYGATANPTHLPSSTSINKQITYGEYIATNEKFKSLVHEDSTIYNAFILPYSKHSSLFKSNSNYKYIGEAISDWKTNELSFEHVQGILLDIKYIMLNYSRYDKESIETLSYIIQESYLKNRKLF